LFSIFLSIPLARLGVTGNQVTVLWTIVGLFASFGLGCPDYALRLWSAVALQFSYLLDFVDGEIARLRQQPSRRGIFLDLVGHGLVKSSVFLGIGYHLFLAGEKGGVILAFCASLAITGSSLVPIFAEFAGLKNTSYPRPDHPKVTAPARALYSGVRDLVLLTFETPGVYAVILVAAVLDRLFWVAVLYGVLGSVWFLYRAVRHCHDTSPS
jgi:phosphatidylglycerophosphate synthase